ncbi:MAG: hypothetical protein K8E24_003175 [Methanobacterium paludis]|nr:hypothetical protein [Methanobacterium paludis]
MEKVDDSIGQLKNLPSKCSHEHSHESIKADLTFKPNPNLGEGKASDRNLEYRQACLTNLKDTVYDPYGKLLKTDKSVEDKIKALDGFIDDYINKGQELVREYLTESFQTNAEQATKYLLAAAKKQGAKYKPKIPDNPERLQQIITMQQLNIEDYGLTLRGRLRSAITSKQWLDGYGSKKTTTH